VAFFQLLLEGRGYYMDTLLKWVREVMDFLWEAGVRCVIEIEGEEIPRIWLCGRPVYEGLPDSEGELLEALLSAARRCAETAQAGSLSLREREHRSADQ
jgi:hypothetical protein